MTWWEGMKPRHCELPGCLDAPARRVFIMGSSRAWLCSAHATELDAGEPLRLGRRRAIRLPQLPRLPWRRPTGSGSGGNRLRPNHGLPA